MTHSVIVDILMEWKCRFPYISFHSLSLFIIYPDTYQKCCALFNQN